MGILQFESISCRDCCKCIGVCPVKSIEVRNHQAMVVERDCILCGSCTVVCPQHLKHGKSGVGRVQELLHQGRTVVASVAPSYAAWFSGCGFGALRKALLQMGFSDAAETAEGAYVVKTAYEELVRSSGGRAIVTSCCPTVNAYVQKHCPEALPCLAPVVTPLQAHARLIREKTPGAAVVFIGPCLSKKDECLQDPDNLACALTFDELEDWMHEKGVAVDPAAEEKHYLSRFFPVSGGILKTMSKQEGRRYLAVDGPENCMSALHDAAAGKLDGCFVEMSFCTGGCIGGPAFRSRRLSLAVSGLHIAEDAVGGGRTESGDPAPDFDLPAPRGMTAAFRDQQVCYPMPTEAQIAAIFKKMGKESPEDELNCGMCGYPSCRDKAIAVHMGRAEITMCMPYMKKRAESLSDKIINITPNAVLAVDMYLKVQQINTAACELFSTVPEDVLGQPVSRLMDEFDFVDLISSGRQSSQKYAFLAEYNLYLHQSFHYDQSSGIIICIMKNITREKQKQSQLKQHKAQVASMADDIVERQLHLVHEIASLLGESAAETKIAVSELKEAVMLENEE